MFSFYLFVLSFSLDQRFADHYYMRSFSSCVVFWINKFEVHAETILQMSFLPKKKSTNASLTKSISITLILPDIKSTKSFSTQAIALVSCSQY